MKGRRSTISGLIIAAALILVAVLTGIYVTRPSSSSGPLATHFSPGAFYRIGGTMRPGQMYAYQGPIVENKTGSHAVIDRAVPVGVPGHVRVVKILTQLLSNKKSLHAPGWYPGFSNGPYPFSTGLRNNRIFASLPFPPLHETVVPPGRNVEIVFVLAAARPGVYLTKGVWVYYHISSSQYRYFEPAQWALCVLPAKCPSWA
jgi:hypothetical protein